jgi:hypothetical protein
MNILLDRFFLDFVLTKLSDSRHAKVLALSKFKAPLYDFFVLWPLLTKLNTYIHTTHAGSPKGQQRHLQDAPTFYQNDLAMRNTADMTGDKRIAVWLQSISGIINPLVAFYDIHERKREVLFFVCCIVLSRTPHEIN